jgi:selenocysteine-specific elongation factor
MFKKPVQEIKQGDRAGVCVPQLDHDLIERGIAAKPRSLKSSDLVIVLVKRIPYFTASEVKSGAKFHISIGHQTAVGTVTFFSCPQTEASSQFNKGTLISTDKQIIFDPKV